MATNFTNNNVSAVNIGNVNYNLKSVPFHATEAEWLSINYVPKQGEIITYDADENYSYIRFKTGDGTTQVNQLPFSLTTLSEVQIYVNNQINSAGHLKRIVLQAGQDLPSIEKAQPDAIYMKHVSGSELSLNIYEEYMVINGAWEVIGNTKVDLNDYATIEYVDQFQGTVKSIDVGTGLKLTGNKTVNPTIDLDESVTFVFNCGTSTEVI